MRKIRATVLLIMIAITMVMLAGCGKGTIQGDWVLVKEEQPDGTVMNQSQLEDIGVAENYHIEEDVVTYTCHVMGRDISFDLVLMENEDGTYSFMLKEWAFATVTLKGKTFSYTVEGEDGISTMYFERVK